MRIVTYILLTLLLLLQYPLWVGKGSWLKVWETDQQIQEQKQLNEQNRKRNAALNAEMHDLKKGTEAIEERARSELGMIKQNEVFFQVVGEEKPAAASGASPAKPKNKSR